MSVNVDTLTNDNGLISAGNGWNMISASMLNNDNGVIQSLGSDSQLQVSGNNMLSNRNGSIHSDGSVSINGALDNMSGTIAAEKTSLCTARPTILTLPVRWKQAAIST